MSQLDILGIVTCVVVFVCAMVIAYHSGKAEAYSEMAQRSLDEARRNLEEARNSRTY
jgi:hypothetical protein